MKCYGCKHYDIYKFVQAVWLLRLIKEIGLDFLKECKDFETIGISYE